MHPSFGVPWPRLQRAAARLTELDATLQPHRVHALIFLCGVKYLLTYRDATGRRLTHYLDDGLRDAVEHTLPTLIRRGVGFRPAMRRAGRLMLPRDSNEDFARLVFAFEKLHRRMPAATARWLEQTHRETNLWRLTFGMGVIARFAPESHEFVRRMLDQPFQLSSKVVDVVESFHWHPDWSVALRR